MPMSPVSSSTLIIEPGATLPVYGGDAGLPADTPWSGSNPSRRKSAAKVCSLRAVKAERASGVEISVKLPDDDAKAGAGATPATLALGPLYGVAAIGPMRFEGLLEFASASISSIGVKPAS